MRDDFWTTSKVRMQLLQTWRERMKELIAKRIRVTVILRFHFMNLSVLTIPGHIMILAFLPRDAPKYIARYCLAIMSVC